MQVKTVSSETNTNPQPVNTDDTTDANKNNLSFRWPSVKMQHNRDCDSIAEVYRNSKFADFPLNVDNIWQRIAVRVTNTTESPYLIKKHTQIAEFTVVTPEQSKQIETAEMAMLSMNPQSDPDLTAYLNE